MSFKLMIEEKAVEELNFLPDDRRTRIKKDKRVRFLEIKSRRL